MSIQQTEEVDQLFAALAEAQGAIENARRDESNPYFNSSYADLASVRDAIRAPFASQGLSILQFPSTDIRPLDNGGVWLGLRLVTRLCHSSGQWIQDELIVPLAKQDAQAIGSATTYARRYSLMAVAGVAPDDDDGNEAAGRGAQVQAHGQAVQSLGYPHNGQQAAHAAPSSPAPSADLSDLLAHHQGRLQQATSLAQLKALFSSSQRDLLARKADPAALDALTKTKDAMKASLDSAAADAAGSETHQAESSAVAH